MRHSFRWSNLPLSVPSSKGWHVHQLDVTNAFLHGPLSEPVFYQQHFGFLDPQYPDHVCHLHKALSSLKQAPRAWYQRFASHILHLGFVGSKFDTFLFSVRRTSTGMFLSQRKYIDEILSCAKIQHCNPCNTPVDMASKASTADGALVLDTTFFSQYVWCLAVLSFTRPDISYVVQQVCLFMHDPRTPHRNALKRILRYLKGTHDFGLSIVPSSNFALTAYSYADWGGCPGTRRSTSSYCVFLVFLGVLVL